MSNLFDPTLQKIFNEDRNYLQQTDLPIITVFGTFTEDLKQLHNKRSNNKSGDIVLSRAHLSMAMAVIASAWKDPGKPDFKRAWLADPTNFVSKKGLRTVDFTEEVGKLIARYPFLKIAKDFVDKFGRKKMPILSSITSPLLFLTQEIHKPILSFHIAAGNIMASAGKIVVQVVTDPHIRDEYLVHASSPMMYYCVFDEQTKLELLEKAAIHDIEMNSERVFVTGPPVDPRVLECRSKKLPWRSGPLNLCITTGGLGTNKQEILAILHELLPEMIKKPKELKLLIYAGTQRDIYEEVNQIIKQHGIPPAPLSDKNALVRVIYHPQIMDANDQLLKYGFTWAHGFITKPSGDMAYDAACSGSFLLTLKEWGDWEHNIREIFEQKNISRRAHVENLYPQLQTLMSGQHKAQPWIEKAMHASHNLDPIFYKGVKNIIKTYKKIAT